MVDLLSKHLYSGPQVYLRELMQNAVDAVTARRGVDPEAPSSIRIEVDDAGDAPPSLRVTDSGIGLTATDATELLATIGRSSKRDDDFGIGRMEFIGQFGIGLLAAFMVADRIVVRSRAAHDGAQPILWEGRADGTFQVSEGLDELAQIPVGTEVLLVARRDAEHWLSGETVLQLAREYGSLLPFDIAVRVPVGDGGELAWRRITEPELPWRAAHPEPMARERSLAAYCEETFGFTPLAHIDLELPLAGASGVAFLLPQAVSPGSGQHRVYMKRMLLGPRIDRVLPEWAFFVRAVVDTDALSPTASREQLHDDELLMTVRDALGSQIKAWVTSTLSTPTPLARSVLETHHLALRALAVTDTEMLELVAEVLPFETSDGPMTLADAAEDGEIVYASTTEAYRRVSAVARAQGLVVVNAGYVYDAELLERLGSRSGWRVRELQSEDLVQVLGVPDLAREVLAADALVRARAELADDDCDVILRSFAPYDVPAILLRDAEGEHRRELDRERAASPELWGGLLDAFATERKRRSRTLVLNDSCAVARNLISAPAGSVFSAGLRSMYLSAVMLAGEGLRSRETSQFSESLGVLLAAALERGGGTQTEES